MEIPEVIAAIQAHGLTQRALAKRCCISQSYCSLLASGKRGEKIGRDIDRRLRALLARLNNKVAA